MARKGRNWRNIVDKGKELEMRGRIVEVGIPLWNRDGLKRHIQFKAGKMYVIDNMVYPDPRKGLVYIDQDTEHVMHFCWMDRDGLGTKETDLTPDPYDASFVRVTKCTTGRVYLLKIKSAKQNHFFWMQEPSEDKDAEICNRVNYLLNFPPLRLRFPQIACNFEMPRGPCLPPNEGNNVNADETNEDMEPVEGLSSNQYDNDELGRMQELLLISTMRNPARILTQDNADLSDTVSPEMIRPILKNADLMRQLGDRERDTSNPEESVFSDTAMNAVNTAMRLGTLIPTLKNLGFSKRIIDAAVKGDWQIFINNLSREDSELDCMETDTDCFRRLKSIVFARDPHTYKTPEALAADIDKIVGALAECNIENGIASVGLENGNIGGNQRSVDEGIGVSSNRLCNEQESGKCNQGVETKKVSASKEEKQVPSTGSSECKSTHRELDKRQRVDVEVFQGVILKTSSKSEGQTEEDSNTEVGRPASNHLGIIDVPQEVLEQEQEPDNANWMASQTPGCSTASACGTQTDGPAYQSKTSLCNRVSRKLLGKSTASLDGSKEPHGSNTEHSKKVSSKQSGKRSFLLTFEESLNQPGCSSSWNPEPTGLKSDNRPRLKRDGATNTDCHAELLDYCRPSTSTHGSIDTVDIQRVGTASLNSRIDEPIEPTFFLPLPNANTDEVDHCLTDTRDRTGVLAIQMVDDTGAIPAKSRSKSNNHEEMGNSSKQEQNLAKSSPAQTPGVPKTESPMSTRTDKLCPSPDPTTVSSSEDVVFVRGPYYESPSKRNGSAKEKRISGRRLQQNDSGQMSSGVRKREGGPRSQQPASKKARTSSPEPHPPPSFRAPDPSPVRSENVGRRYPCSKRSPNLLGTANEEKDEPGNSSRKRPNDLGPPDSDKDEPPTKKSRSSGGSGSSRSNSGTSKTRKSDGSRTPTPTGSSSSETSRSTLRAPRALKQSDSKVSDASSRKGEASHRYNLRRRSTEQETRPEVDSEQQTEPVRIRQIKRAGPETRLRTISRTPRAGTMTNRDRSQNTEPVHIEDKSKPKDRKPPESNKKPGA